MENESTNVVKYPQNVLSFSLLSFPRIDYAVTKDSVEHFYYKMM